MENIVLDLLLLFLVLSNFINYLRLEKHKKALFLSSEAQRILILKISVLETVVQESELADFSLIQKSDIDEMNKQWQSGNFDNLFNISKKCVIKKGDKKND